MMAKKRMNYGGSKKVGYMDLGGNFIDMSNVYKTTEPVSGMSAITNMGAMSESDFGPKPKKGKMPQRSTGKNKVPKRVIKKGSACYRKGNC